MEWTLATVIRTHAAARGGAPMLTYEGRAISYAEMEDAEVCCGFGGTFCVKYPEISNAMVGEKSADITFDRVTFDGAKVSGYGDGVGLRVKDSVGVSVLNSEFFDFEMAISMTSSDDTIIANNKIRGISFDAMMLGGMKDVTIAYNEFTDFHSRNLLHQDVIQFVTSGSGGPLILDGARAVLAAEFPELADINIQLPDEKSRRVGQSIAAASLPALR